MDEVDTYIRKRWAENPANETFTTRATRKDRANPLRQYGELPWVGTGMGGSGDHWGATSPRLMPEALRLASHLRERWGASRLPPNITIQDFGITWEEIEPYYTRAEEMMGTGGKAGNLNGRKIEGGNIFEGPRSREFPNPPHAMPYAPAVVCQGGEGAGVSPFSDAVVDLEPELREPGRNRPRRLPVLRPLLRLRLHGGRQGQSELHAVASARRTERTSRRARTARCGG